MNSLEDQNRILIFLGAGASLEAGFPGTQDLTKEIEGCYNEINSDLKNLIDYFKAEYKQIIGSINTQKNYNYETLLSFLHCLNEIKYKKFQEVKKIEGFYYPWEVYLRSVACNIDEDAANKAIIEIIEYIITKFHEREKSEVKNNYLKNLGTFSNNLSTKGYKLNFATTNYDLNIENALRKKEIKFETGFAAEETNHQNISKPYYFPDISTLRPTSTKIFKLHGSLNWRTLNDKPESDKNPYDNLYSDLISFGISEDNDNLENSLIIKNGRTLYINRHNVVIGGIKATELFNRPFLIQINAKFIEELQESKYIIFSGYSFSDNHINSILLQSIPVGATVVIISPDDPNDYIDFLKKYCINREDINFLGIYDSDKCKWNTFLENINAKKDVDFIERINITIAPFNGDNKTKILRFDDFIKLI